MQTGVAGVVGLTFKGIYEEIQRKHGRAVDGHIPAMLIVQGYNEAKDLTARGTRFNSRAVQGGGRRWKSKPAEGKKWK
jgi:hypothetical protein